MPLAGAPRRAHYQGWMAFEHLHTMSRGYIPNTHRAIVRGGEDESLIGAPFHSPDCVRVTCERLQAASVIQVPQTDVNGTGQDPPLLLVERQILHMGGMGVDHSLDAAARDIPNANCSIPRA